MQSLSRAMCASLWTGAVALVAAVGCAGPSTIEPSREARAEAAEIYGERCATCHGVVGKGNGPEVAKLKTKPRNFGEPTWQLAISDRELEKVILGGGAAVGKSDEMPANPDLADKPEVLTALSQHVRVLVHVPEPSEYVPDPTAP